MAELFDELADSLFYSVPLALVVFAIIVLCWRKRLVHVFDPILLDLLPASFGIAGFAAIYRPNEYAWRVTLAGVLLAILPVIVLYRRSLVSDTNCLEKRRQLGSSIEFRVLITLFLLIQIGTSLTILASTGFTIGEKVVGPKIMRAVGQLTYFYQVTTNFFPAMLLINRRSKVLSLVIVALVLRTLCSLVAASRASLMAPVLLVGFAFFLNRLDRRTAFGWEGNSLITRKNVVVATTVLSVCALLVVALASIVSVPAELFLFAFLLRFFLSFDSLFQAIQFSLLSPKTGTTSDFSVLVTYTQPVHKLLHLDVGQIYNNLGEYIAVNVYHFDIWKNPDAMLFAMPNSNMVLEFLLSFGLWWALALILCYSIVMVCAIGWFERRRYDGVGTFCISQVLMMAPLQFLFDGTSFVVCLYALGALIASIKVISYVFGQFRLSLATQGPAPSPSIATDARD